MLWHEQSWLKHSKIDKNTPVIVPCGSIEQHGKHLPIVVDTLQVTHIAEQAEKLLGEKVLLTPTLWLGSSHHHMDFPGTLSLTPELYSQVIQQLAKSVMNAGYKRIIFLNGHGGNHTPISQALTELACTDDQADETRLILATWWILARENLTAEKLGMESNKLSHACEYETSNVLHLRPDLVDMSEAVDVDVALDNDWVDHRGSPKCVVTVFDRFHRCTPTGSMGKSTSATAEKGERIMQGAISKVVELVNSLDSWADTPIIAKPKD